MYALPHYSLTAVTGAQSESFLQGQLTCDMRLLEEHHALLAACCDHKGRAIVSLMVLDLRDIDPKMPFLLWGPLELQDTLITHLSKYACFSRVALTPCTQWQALGTLEMTSSRAPTDPSFVLPGLPLRKLILKPTQEILPAKSHSTAWELAQIKAQFCLIPKILSGQLIPLSLDYERLNGISFQKGCYVGQEILARAHYRGQLKRHLHTVILPRGSDPNPGDELSTPEETAGPLISVAQADTGEWQALAVLKDSSLIHSLYHKGQKIQIVSEGTPAHHQ